MHSEQSPIKHPVKIVGSFLSPMVRKALAVLDLKDIPYEIDPIIAFMGGDAFGELSPVRRIPLMIDDDITVSDSTVVCEYLDERYPNPPVYPTNPVDRARARWIEEFADTRMQEVFSWHLFNQFTINPLMWGEDPNEKVVERAKTEEIPHILDYLETILPKEGFLFGHVCVPDIAIANHFRNASFVDFRPDEDRWPISLAFADRVLEIDSLKKLGPYEDVLVTTMPNDHRKVLGEMGVPLIPETLGEDKSQRGFMIIN